MGCHGWWRAPGNPNREVRCRVWTPRLATPSPAWVWYYLHALFPAPAAAVLTHRRTQLVMTVDRQDDAMGLTAYVVLAAVPPHGRTVMLRLVAVAQDSTGFFI